MSKPVRPAKRLMAASSKCSLEGTAYGKCMLEKYSTVEKGVCEAEFARFKACVEKVMK